jgi:transcriptional regulator with XRE-family HTH domain
MNAGYSPIPNRYFLQELQDDDFRENFVADHLRMRIALLIRALREQRGWSQAELGRRLGKPQSVISRLEDPDYGKVTLQTLFEVAAAFGLPLYIDMPNWEDWFRLMEDMSRRNLRREEFDFERLAESAERQSAVLMLSSAEEPLGQRKNDRVGVQNALNSSSDQTMTSLYLIKSIPARLSAEKEAWFKGLLQPAMNLRTNETPFRARIDPERNADITGGPNALVTLRPQEQSLTH